MAEGRQRAVGRIVRSGESERGRRHRAKEGDTTEETFQMCYRLLNKFRVKLPDIVSTAVAPAGRKWRIKAANLPVFIRLFVAPRVAAPLLFPRRFRALARKEYVCASLRKRRAARSIREMNVSAAIVTNLLHARTMVFPRREKIVCLPTSKLAPT